LIFLEEGVLDRGTSQVFKVGVIKVKKAIADNRDMSWAALKSNIIGIAWNLY
jgi:hypothetical protein